MYAYTCATQFMDSCSTELLVCTHVQLCVHGALFSFFCLFLMWTLLVYLNLWKFRKWDGIFNSLTLNWDQLLAVLQLVAIYHAWSTKLWGLQERVVRFLLGEMCSFTQKCFLTVIIMTVLHAETALLCTDYVKAWEVAIQIPSPTWVMCVHLKN